MFRALTIFLSILYFSSSGQNIINNWKFSKIDNGENSVREIGSNDFLNINKDGSFEYYIESINLNANGNWLWKGDKVTFIYQTPNDTTRTYLVELKNNKLTLKEGSINYKFIIAKNTFINNILRGLLGLLSLIFISYLFSQNKKAINWNIVWKGLIIQFIFAICILKVPFIQNIFEWLSSIFVTILSFTREGSVFLFGNLVENIDSFGYIFAFQVLPTIIFFSALTSVLFYYGILQKAVLFFAYLMRKLLNLSGSESLAAAGNIFLGQTESPLLIKPYIEKMSLSELFCLMSGGMSTIAGGVLAAYIGFLGGNDLESQLFFAKHLLAASVMSAPAAIIASKIIIPETQKVNDEMNISSQEIGSNVLEAISNGTTQGLKLAVNVGAMLLVFIAFIYMINYFLNQFVGEFTGLNEFINSFTNGKYTNLSLEFILGYTLAPVTWLMGVCKEDMILVGQLLGEKIILNEFVAYISLSEFKTESLFFENKSVIIATYILCGFANFASIGIQIGGIGTLAPSRTKDLSKLGLLSLVAGTLACLFTAVIVGMLI
ncbi:MAG: NupC/NupG family nucleoside CNT transporter [Flavobacteriales bacterium]